MDYLSGSLALWLLVGFGQWEARAGDQRERGERGCSIWFPLPCQVIALTMSAFFHSRPPGGRCVASALTAPAVLSLPRAPSDIGAASASH